MTKPSLKFVSAIAATCLIATTATACGGDHAADKGADKATTAVSSPAATGSESAGADSAAFPRTIKHALGETVIKSKPKRIVSTTVTATGTLLAIGAPVVASAATTPGKLTNDQGFFSQWAKVADERGVKVLYPNLKFDMESLIAADPDLVVVSTTGADSVSDEYAQISAQFPTIAVNYSKESWQELATEFGKDLGLEKEAAQAIKDFNDYAAEKGKGLDVPAGGVTIVSYNGPGKPQGVAKVGGPHAGVLEAMGIELKGAPANIEDASKRNRKDFTFVSLENLPQAIQGDTVFILGDNGPRTKAFLADPLMQNIPAVKAGHVYPLGVDSFRIDPYSAHDMVTTVSEALSKK